MLKVKEIFNIDKLNELKTVAGFSGLNREIFNVNIIENPESYSWFTAGDFILTTGYVFKDSIKDQIKLIEELYDQNASGIGIKTKRYWEEVPKEIIDKANELGLPVIELPYNLSLAEVMNAINVVLFNRENSALNKYRDIYNAYRKVQIEGGSYKDILEISANLVNNSLLFVDDQFNLLSYFDYFNCKRKLSDYLTLNLNEKVFTSDFTKDLPTDPNKFSLSIKKTLKVNDENITLRIKPVLFAKKIYGYIIVFETFKKLEKLDYIALESAEQSFAMEMKRLKELEEASNKYREDFFTSLIEGKFLSIDALKNLALNNGIYPNNNHLVVVINVLDDVLINRNKILSIFSDINNFDSKFKFHLIERLHKIIILIDILNETKLNQVIKNDLNKLTNLITNKYYLKFLIGVSPICQNFAKISNYIKLAEEVIKLSNNMNVINYYEDLMAYHLIRNGLNNIDKENFVKYTIKPLIDYDLNKNDSLYETLKTYFECNQSIAKTASEMFAHRNTIIYRLDKIKNILNIDLNNSENLFTLELAIKINEVINK